MEKELEAKNGKAPEAERDWSGVPFWTSQRFLTAVLTFCGFACLYLMRINLSIAMVCMVRSDFTDLNQTAQNATNVSSVTLNNMSQYTLDKGKQSDLEEEASGSSYCESLGLSQAKSEEGEFTWDKELQGLLLGSFFWGYLVLQIPGGMLSESYGPRRVVFYTMFPVALLNLVSPPAARASPWLFLVIRVLVGVGEGSLYPAAQAMFARWSPPSERSRLVGISLSGGQFGNALIFPIGGVLCSTVGWESVFYIMGAIGAVWCLLWFFLVADSPAQSSRITELERAYIETQVSFRHKQKSPPKPWRAIFTSRPFWAIMAAHTCGNYGLYMMLTQIPTYMKEVLKFDLKSNGAFSMLPYLCMWMCISLAGMLADAIITKKILTRIWTRRLMSSLGLFIPAVCLVGLAYMDCTQQIPAVILLCGAVGINGFTFAGYLVNHGDIAPPFAGTLFGISNVSASIPGILAPYIVGAITKNKTREEWQVAFFICAIIYIVGGIIFNIFCQTNVQPWAVPPATNQEVEVPEAETMLQDEPGLDGQEKRNGEFSDVRT